MPEEKFICTDKLYHYTTFNSALKILITQTLQFSYLANMNDIYEQSKLFFYAEDAHHNVSNFFVKEIAKYKQISLTEDSPLDNGRKGFDIPAMWAHYADKGNGVCLVFDKKKLLRHVRSNWLNGQVKYIREFDNNIVASEVKTKQDVVNFIKNKSNEIFLCKSEDWAYEQEFRIVAKTSVRALDVSDCIMCVLIMERTFEELEQRKNIFSKVGYSAYQYSNFLGNILIKDGENQIYPNHNIEIDLSETPNTNNYD